MHPLLKSLTLFLRRVQCAMRRTIVLELYQNNVMVLNGILLSIIVKDLRRLSVTTAPPIVSLQRSSFRLSVGGIFWSVRSSHFLQITLHLHICRVLRQCPVVMPVGLNFFRSLISRYNILRDVKMLLPMPCPASLVPNSQIFCSCVV